MDKNAPKATKRAEIGFRLKEERERLGVKAADFSEYGDWPTRTVYGWEAGKATPKAEFFADVQSLGLDVQYIITGKRSSVVPTGPAPAPAESADAIRLPMLGAKGSMGPGNDVLDDVIVGDVAISLRWLKLNLPRSRPEALQLVHAYGDSMAGTLNSGDFAIVDTDCIAPDVDGVYVLEANDQLFIKRVTRRIDGGHEVTSDNPSVRTVSVLDGSYPVRVRGRVVYGWNGRRL